MTKERLIELITEAEFYLKKIEDNQHSNDDYSGLKLSSEVFEVLQKIKSEGEKNVSN